MSKARGVAYDDMINSVGYRLKVAVNVLRGHIDTQLRPLGIAMPQYVVLHAIEIEPGISNASLARDAFVTPQTMQQVVSIMERDGLLSREPHPRHGRILMMHLTEKGQTVLAEAHTLVRGAEQRFLTGMSESEIVALKDLVMRGIGNMA